MASIRSLLFLRRFFFSHLSRRHVLFFLEKKNKIVHTVKHAYSELGKYENSDITSESRTFGWFQYKNYMDEFYKKMYFHGILDFYKHEIIFEKTKIGIVLLVKKYLKIYISGVHKKSLSLIQNSVTSIRRKVVAQGGGQKIN